jgi:FtsZ-interacting cell division protein ZipA
MGPIDPDAPWYANITAYAITAIIVALVGAMGAYWASRRTNRRLEGKFTDSHKDLQDIKTQVQNSHTESNLREDIDELREFAEKAHTSAELAAEAAHRVERYVRDVDRSVRSLEHSLDRHTEQQAKELAEAVEDRNRAIAVLRDSIPITLAQALEQHDAEHHSGSTS